MSESKEDSGAVRRGLRVRRSTIKALEYAEVKTTRSVSSSDSEGHKEENEFSGEEIHVEDTVSTDLAGKEIYSFNKIKKHERILGSPQTPSKKNEKQEVVPKTPANVRKRIGRGIKKVVQQDSSSDDDPFSESGSDYSASHESGSTSSDDESESENDGTEKLRTQSTSDESEGDNARRLPKTPKSLKRNPVRKKAAKQMKYVISTEDYFSNNSNKKTVTSNNTLDKLKTPRLNQADLQKLLSQMTLSKAHQKAVFNLSENAKDHFDKWILLLQENFSIVVYGLGSKRNVLHEFQETVLKDLPTIVINGFFPSLTLKDILDAFVHDLLELKENPGNVFDSCDLIAREFALVPDQHLYLLIHNIDGDMLRNHKSQSVLAQLSSIRNIHLVASIDHINAPLIWDHTELSKFNFIWFDVTSYLPYSVETSYESSLLVQRTGTLALSSLRNIFLSLTSNSKGIYMIILKYQLEHGSNQYYQGLQFKDLYSKCREAFLVSSDLALRGQLTEFTDHKIVRLKRAADGAEYLVIPIANGLLQKFASEQSG